MRDLGARDEVGFHPIGDGEGPWIPGRGAKIKVGDIFVGGLEKLTQLYPKNSDSKSRFKAENSMWCLSSAIPDPLL